MALEFSESNSEFRNYCVFSTDHWMTEKRFGIKHTVIAEFGIRFGKLEGHVCGNELMC
jgi:hypothetical protein